ncbi:MAG: hypothetical protein ACHQ1D_00510 [Nitrososphaerales archaeon]
MNIEKSVSPANSLNKEDLKSLVTQSLIVGALSSLTYFSENLIGVDFGDNSAFIVAALTVLSSTLIKFLSGTK